MPWTRNGRGLSPWGPRPCAPGGLPNPADASQLPITCRTARAGQGGGADAGSAGGWPWSQHGPQEECWLRSQLRPSRSVTLGDQSPTPPCLWYCEPPVSSLPQEGAAEWPAFTAVVEWLTELAGNTY